MKKAVFNLPRGGEVNDIKYSNYDEVITIEYYIDEDKKNAARLGDKVKIKPNVAIGAVSHGMVFTEEHLALCEEEFIVVHINEDGLLYLSNIDYEEWVAPTWIELIIN